MSDATKAKFGEVRFSYPAVFVPKAMSEGQPEKYSVSVLIKKTDKRSINTVRKAIKAAALRGKSESWGGKIPKNWKNPLRDGDKEKDDDPSYEGCYFINATSHRPPGVVDKRLQPIVSAEEFYAGCYGNISINFYPYNSNGNKGVAAGLQNVMKTRDGEPLAGGVSAEVDFADFVVKDDEESDDDLF